jgi:2'-5' RNA ligase
MTLPPVIRVFFAIDLPMSAKEELGRFISTLKKKARTHGIRWAKPVNLHITLQFLAETHTEHLPTLIGNVRSRLKGATHALNLECGALHLFPSPYHPRVIVLEVTPGDKLTELSRLIGEGIKATNYEIEDRPFRAHLTLGRIKQPKEINLNFLSECDLPDLEDLKAEEVVLFRSEPKPEGSEYTVMEKIQFE